MRVIVLITAAGLCATYAQAEEKRDLDAHEHGVGALNIALEAGEMAMEFEAPGADIVGFEHTAKSAEDRARVDAAIAMLAKPLELFQLPEAAKCTLVKAEVELHGGEYEHHDEHHDEHHGEHHEEHAEHGAKGEHHEEHPDAHHDEHEEARHAEFHAEYRLTCAAPDAIDRIEFGYFQTFPNAEQLEVQMISDKGSKGFEVERNDPVLELDGLI